LPAPAAESLLGACCLHKKQAAFSKELLVFCLVRQLKPQGSILSYIENLKQEFH
jgi:hypothetical protein